MKQPAKFTQLERKYPLRNISLSSPFRAEKARKSNGPRKTLKLKEVLKMEYKAHIVQWRKLRPRKITCLDQKPVQYEAQHKVVEREREGKVF